MTIPNIQSFGSEQQEERIIIFIDILGFSQFIKNMSSEDENNLQRTYQILEEATHTGCLTSRGVFRPSFTFFSDTIIISWPTNCLSRKHSLIFAATQAEQIQRQFIQELNLLSRGVIHKGKLYHNHPTLYGLGLIEAYYNEKDHVINPQVVLSSQAIKFFDGELDLSDATIGRYLRNDNGRFSIFFLNFLQNKSVINRVLEFKTIIESNINQRNSFGSLEKWSWFARQFNEHVLQWHTMPAIQISRYTGLKLFIHKLRRRCNLFDCC